MRRRRCSTMKDCASDGGATTSQNGVENCAPVTARYPSYLVSSATPRQQGDLRSLLSKPQLIDKKLLRNNARSRHDGPHSHPPSSPIACLRNSAPPQQCPRGFFICKVSHPTVAAARNRAFVKSTKKPHLKPPRPAPRPLR